MRGTCFSAESFNSDLSEWDVSNVTDMGCMFFYAKSFNADLSNWNVSRVADMPKMFSEATSFNCDLSNWDVSSVTNMYDIFEKADVFDGRLSTDMVANMHALGEHRPRRCLWNMARRLVIPIAKTRCIAYYWFELAAHPGPNGEAPTGAIDAFEAEF